MQERFSWFSLLGLSGLIFLLLKAPVAISSDDLSGIWLDQDRSGYIEIRVEDDKAQGRIAGSVSGTVDADTKNPDPALRGHSLLGMRILRDLHYDGSRYWTGSIYNPRDGRTYSARVSVIDANTLSVHGYIGVPMLGQTQKWTRVTDPGAPGLKRPLR
jgi:uncharacterized protein (DUF2147 family)